MRIDLVGRDIQGIETVADERQVIQPLRQVSVRPGALRESRAEEVVGHAPVGCRKKRERVHQRSAARNARVACHDGDGLVELPANVAGNNNRRGPGGRPDGEAVSRPLIEHVAAEDEHRAIDRDVVARMNLAANAQVVGERLVAALGVEIAELGVDVELQQERHVRVRGSFPDDDSVFIAFVLAVVRERMPPAVRHSLPAVPKRPCSGEGRLSEGRSREERNERQRQCD